MKLLNLGANYFFLFMVIKYLKHILSKLTIRSVLLHYKLNKLYKAKRVIIDYDTVIRNTVLGFDVFIGADCLLDNSIIGDNTYFNFKTKVNNSIIGKFCSIGSNVKIGVGSHPTHMVSTHPAFYANNKGFETFADKMYYHEEHEKIIIGNDVWIGSDVTILNNVKIGNGAIIALGSIVTKDIPDYAIVAGIPAKIVRFRFNEKDIAFLNEIKWWDFEMSFLKNNFKIIHDIEKLRDYNSILIKKKKHK
jgi:acetyltransferase-like isoleucine patch superfamily enzyme